METPGLQHAILCAIKDLAIELDRAPTRDELVARTGYTRSKIDTYFGSFGALLVAAGLSQSRERPEKITNQVFERDLVRHLEDYTPAPYKPPGEYPTAAVISDLHWPFHSQRVLEAFFKYVAEKLPEFVIINGDAWDMYSASKFPRSHNLFTPKEERLMCLKQNSEFWARVLSLSPNSKCFQLMGNHDLRPMKRTLETNPIAEEWVLEGLKRDFSFEGVSTVLDHRQELFLREDIAAYHGYFSTLGAHRDFTLMNTINAHTHIGGVVWRQFKSTVYFEANSGLAGDPQAKGLSYTPQKLTKWTPGFLGLEKRGPLFIPA